MKRRNFLIQGSLTASGVVFLNSIPSFARAALEEVIEKNQDSLYQFFKEPAMQYRPYVRWWWNGDKIQKEELARELRILKAAGIGGVEINPISFPMRTDDMNIASIDWLSDEWVDLLEFTLKEAKSLDMKCDLIAGTGFPFGAEFLTGEERSEIVVIGVAKLNGPLKTELSLFDLYKEADPKITNPYTGRTMEMLSVKMIPDPLNSMDEVVDLSDQIKNGVIKVSVPKGKYAVYALVKVQGFMKVIQGAPGGMGPVLNHFNKDAVDKYLNRITDTIQKKTGPLSPYIRSFFVDSMETEGANWMSDIMDEFKKRRGYDLFPYLPFILFRIGGMGNTFEKTYTADTGKELKEMFNRMRYDFELTKAELFQERFVRSFAKWCTDNKVKSRAQAYGRGYFLLEGSFDIDIPECETWLKYGIGEDISEEDFTKYPWHLGQGNTMINKFVSSAAHLKDKKLISSEELTNTDMVFNESFEIFKIAGDQSTISGVTQPVFHGFNYSPKNAPFPGWITYGGYFNEKNTMWPFMKYYTDYRARLSALLQQATMFADIAILAPIPDMWSEDGAQNEPFPTIVSPAYQALIWESIHQNGNGCDYVSEDVINHSGVKNGSLTYGSRKYNTLILIEVKSLNPSTAQRLYEFVNDGGRVFCIENFPEKSLGWSNYQEKDKEVQDWVFKMKQFSERFILLKKPEKDFNGWYRNIQEKYEIKPYVIISESTRHITQMRYQAHDAEIIFFTNSSSVHDYTLRLNFSKDMYAKKQAWLWDAVTGEKFKLEIKDGKYEIDMGPAESRLFVFNQERKGNYWKPKPKTRTGAFSPDAPWNIELRYYDGSVKNTTMSVLKDLKEILEYAHFAGTIIYRNTFTVDDPKEVKYVNLGKVYGISQVRINDKDAGTLWYGQRIHDIGNLIHKGSNTIEVTVVTVMLNYMKTLKNNAIAQYWTNEKRKDQPLQSLGVAGPVKIY